MVFRFLFLLLALSFSPMVAIAQSCTLSFRVLVTQGIRPMPPGSLLEGSARLALSGASIRQEGGSITHLATGEMHLGPDITGRIWALGVTAHSPVADLIAVFARDVSGLSFGGLAYGGPMMITLYGPPGSRPDTTPPTTQADWDAMTLQRRFALHAPGYDRIAGDITALAITCDGVGVIDSGPKTP